MKKEEGSVKEHLPNLEGLALAVVTAPVEPGIESDGFWFPDVTYSGDWMKRLRDGILKHTDIPHSARDNHISYLLANAEVRKKRLEQCENQQERTNLLKVWGVT